MTTKRQHLIWRKYLAPWTNSPEKTNGKIFCYDVFKKNIRYQSIEDVGVEKYTYDMSMIKDEDKEIAFKYYQNWLNNKNNMHFNLQLVESEHLFEKDYIEKNYICVVEKKGEPFLRMLYNMKFPFSGPPYLENKKTKLEEVRRKASMGELSEKELNPLLEENDKKREEYLREPDNRYVFYEFLAVQMMRTWKAKECIMDSKGSTIQQFPNTKLRETSEAIFPLMMMINSDILACALYEHNIELIENMTNIEFITCDFPIINLCANYKDKENVKDFEIFYPISPVLAIVCKKSLKINRIKKEKDISNIDRLNSMVITAATKQVYAKSESVLGRYI